ncbi:hypothetical protein RB595_010739 [Gaeumannomyces hyphopodioides]
MADQSQIISDNPIGNRLARFHALFNSICDEKKVPRTPDALGQLDQEELQDLAFLLLQALQSLPVTVQLHSKTRHRTLRSDLQKLISAAASNDFEFNCVEPLLRAALAEDPNDALIWDQVYRAIAVAGSTPSPQPRPSSLQQTPSVRNSGSCVNSAESRPNIDKVLRSELGSYYINLPRFRETFFGNVTDLEAASEAFWKECTEGSDPLFGSEGWRGWPAKAEEKNVLDWFDGILSKLNAFAKTKNYKRTLTCQRRPLAQPNKPIKGSIATRKLDVGLMDDPNAEKNSKCHWSQILVLGELKSNRFADTTFEAGLDLGRHARKVFAAQDTRRFVLGFTLCGFFMRLWEFDRLGAIASNSFDINENGLQFISTIFGFLWMNEEELGFDPTIVKEDG